jgi:hypothetical protein
MKNYTRSALTMLACMSAWACSEPDKIVSSSTEDGQFRLSIEAEENWVRPSGELPVMLRIERIGGPPSEDFFGEVELVTNGGGISPSSVSVEMAAPDSLGVGGEDSFMTWLVFTASSRASTTDRADIRAFFGDTLTTLRIRVVPAEE